MVGYLRNLKAAAEISALAATRPLDGLVWHRAARSLWVAKDRCTARLFEEGPFYEQYQISGASIAN